MKKLFVGVIFAIPFICRAEELSIFGLEFGKAINLPECELMHISTPSKKYYEAITKQVCVQDAHALNGYGQPVREIDFPSKESPAIVKNFRIYPLEIDGLLAGVHFLTYGVASQEAVIQALNEKYGKPKELKKNNIQNGFGAIYEEYEGVWKSGSLTITFHGVSQNTSYGEVYIDLPSATVLRESWVKSEESKQKKL